MSVVNLKSTQLTNRDSTPVVLTNSFIGRSVVKEGYGWVGATSGDSIASVYRLVTLPSNSRLSSIVVSCDALGTSAAIGVGAYYQTSMPATALGGTVINATFFASALSVATALSKSNVTNQSTSYTYDKQEMPLWLALGLSADPECNFDICATVSAAIAATGKLAMNVSYNE
jgi:hypothetical protein